MKSVEERISNNAVNLWSSMKKRELHMWTSNNKRVKVKDGDKAVELAEDRALFACMLVVSKARTIELRQHIGIYEFIVVPRAFFALDGSLLYVTSKGDLMVILKSLPQDQAFPDIQTEDMDTSWSEENMEVDNITQVLRKVTEMWPLLMEWQNYRVLISYHGFKHANSLPATL